MDSHNASPWLSLILPAYNVEPYLEECLNSITSQMCQGIEIICVDDASTDGTASLLEKFKKTLLPNLEIIQHSENRGLGYARNSGLEIARGNYIWHVDPDDILLPGAIKNLLKTIEEHNPDLILCDFERYAPNQPASHQDLGRTFPGPSRILENDVTRLIAGIFHNGQMHVWTKISKRSLWEDNSIKFPIGRSCVTDISTIPLILFKTKSYIHIPEPWIKYRQREDSILATMTKQKAVDIMRAFTDWRIPDVLLTQSVKLNVSEFMFGMLRAASGTLRKVNSDEDTPQLILGFFETHDRLSPLKPETMFAQMIFNGRYRRAKKDARWYYATKLRNIWNHKVIDNVFKKISPLK